MKKRIFYVLLVASVLVLPLTGCGNTTVKSVITKMTNKMSSVKSIDSNLDLKLGMKINSTENYNITEDYDSSVSENDTTKDSSEDLIEMNVNLNANLSALEYSDSKSRTKMEGSTNISMLGFDVSAPILVYNDIDGDTCISYNYNSDNQVWNKTTSTVDISNIMHLDFVNLIDKLSLSNDNISIFEKDCYELRGTFTGEDIDSILSIIKSSTTGVLDSANLDNINADVSIYVNRKSYEPVGIVIDLSNIDTASLYDDLEEEVDYELSEFVITIRYIGINSVDSIDIPSDALSIEEVSTDSTYEEDKIDYVVSENNGNTEETSVSENSSLYDDKNWIEYVNNNFPTTFEDETFSYQIWSFENDYLDNEKCYVVEVKNITDRVVCGDGAIRAYDIDGNLVDADSYSIPALSAGQEYAEVYYVSNSVVDVKLSMISDTVFDSDKPIDVTITEKSVSDDVITFDVVNNASEDLYYANIQIVFFKDGNAVDNTYLYGDDTFPTGKSVEMFVSVQREYDSYKIYPWGIYQ